MSASVLSGAEKDPSAIACIVMASGLSSRYGRDKLLEPLCAREVLLHTVSALRAAHLLPLTVTRIPRLQALLTDRGYACVLHDGPKKSDTMRVGLAHTDPHAAGILFMPGDQPLITPASLRRLAEHFSAFPQRACRLAWQETPGSPVLFPCSLRPALLAYDGDRGGLEVLRQSQIPCDLVQAAAAQELWDVDTPERMQRVREVLSLSQ